ncbi:MAG TPA: penicillin acylase family protein, partial [Burkholderiaceae bacterium]
KQRIDEVLGRTGKATVEDMQRLQNDVVSLPARRLLALVKPLRTDNAKAQAAQRLLAGWEGEISATGSASALFEVWLSRHLPYRYKDAVLSREAARVVGSADIGAMLAALEQPAARFGKDALRKRDELLASTLAAAWEDTQRLLGPEPSRWRWGRLQFSYFMHPMSQVVDKATRAQLDVGPFPRGGSNYTVNASGYHPANFWQLSGASFRIVIDVGGWDNSRAINTPGQSGDPASPHYRDLAAMWAAGEYFPLLYTKKAIDAATESTIELLPARRK